MDARRRTTAQVPATDLGAAAIRSGAVRIAVSRSTWIPSGSASSRVRPLHRSRAARDRRRGDAGSRSRALELSRSGGGEWGRLSCGPRRARVPGSSRRDMRAAGGIATAVACHACPRRCTAGHAGAAPSSGSHARGAAGSDDGRARPPLGAGPFSASASVARPAVAPSARVARMPRSIRQCGDGPLAIQCLAVTGRLAGPSGRTRAPRPRGPLIPSMMTWPTRLTSATSRSSPTSTTASRRSPTASSSSPTPSIRENARAGARLDGPRARARDHDQGAGGAGRVRGRRRRDVPAAPDRHARPRRLLLRGVAVARRLRGRAARRRRRARGSRRRPSPTPTWRSTRGSS